MKGTTILSHPFVLLGELHQTTGISKRQGQAVSSLCHPPPSSCSIPCCYSEYTLQESTGSKKCTLKCGCHSACCGLGHPATNLPAAHPSHPHGPTQQAKASSNATMGLWKESPCPFPYRTETQGNLKDRSTTRGDIGMSSITRPA